MSRLTFRQQCLGWARIHGIVPKEKRVSDIRVENHGTLFLLHGVSERGSGWLLEVLDEDVQRFGRAFVVEPRYVPDILVGAAAAELEVE